MTDFDKWFLLAYTAYTCFAIVSLMWVGRIILGVAVDRN